MEQKPFISTKKWILFIAAAAVILLVLCFAIKNMGLTRTTARILQDGELLYEIDLSSVTEEHSIRIECPDGGYNIVSVKPGMIRVSEADCPDKICVNRGWATGGVSPVVCMPHKLVIRFDGDGETDAVTG